MKQIIIKVLTRQARRFIHKNNPKIVGIAGSIGKTSTTQAIACVLRERFSVRATIKSYNTDIGVPCTIFQQSLPETLNNPFAWIKLIISNEFALLKKTQVDFLVLELGTDRPGDLALFHWLPVDVCVVTAIADEHMEYFGSLDAVATEELSVAQFSKKLLVNSLMVDKKYLERAVLSETHVDFYDRNQLEDFGLQDSDLQVAAKHSLDAVVAALQVGKLFGMELEALQKGAKQIIPQPGRMRKLVGIKESTIIDDTYNASPKATVAALNYLYSLDASQKIALLGNMNELGKTSAESHREIGAYCDPKQLDLVVTLGPDANEYTAAAAESAGCSVIRVESPYEAAEKITAILKAGAAILCKGSQNKVFAEEAVKKLLADPNDVSQIVRQSPFWMAKKRECFNDAE